MNIDDMLNNLQADLDRRLEEYMPRENNTPEVSPSAEDSEDTIFCPECGARVESDANFCPNCGESLNDDCQCDDDDEDDDWYDDEEEDDDWCDDDEATESVVILFTDSAALAGKYGVSENDVTRILLNHINELQSEGHNGYLLDASKYSLGGDDVTWMDYRDLIADFMDDNNIDPSPKVSLFIIGGNDVIFQPAIKNPSFSPSPWGDNEYQETIFADFLYCFDEIDREFLDYNRARCSVSRLPLESGKIESSIEDDIESFLASSLEVVNGLSISNAMMITNRDWIPASREMSRNLPIASMSNREGYILDNMYVSPNYYADSESEEGRAYWNALENVDMLVCNLHGACMPAQSGFYSDNLAFSTAMGRRTHASIFNTVACWGARYIRYQREDSMLLNALYNSNVLLYSGACVPAFGKCGNYESDGTWRIQPAAYSETFMARFAEYQCIGTLPVGQAFLKAKCDYYNSSRMIEEDELTWSTVLMFNLYGHPVIRTTPDVGAISQMQSDDGSKMQRIPFRPMKKEVVMMGDAAKNCASKGGSILDAVRSAVDANLRILHEGIVKNLYNALGVEPRELFCVEKYEVENGNGTTEKGYLYNYVRARGDVNTKIRVKVDQNGSMLDAIQTK
jgi:hypothetical protein